MSTIHQKLRDKFDYDPSTGLFTYKLVSPKYPWKKVGDTAGGVDRRGYVVIWFNGKLCKAHRLAWFYVYGEWPKHQIDHKNEIKHDNRIDNLRDVPQGPNQHNRRGVVGFGPNGWGRWRARITVNNKHIQIGTYSTKEEARAAYLKAKKILHQQTFL